MFNKIIVRTALTLATVAVAAGPAASLGAAAGEPTKSERTVRISVVTAGQPDDISGVSSNPVLSSRGTFVAFDSAATNLVAGDSNAADDIFVRDRSADRTELISVSTAGAQADEDSARPSIGGDGNVVAFESAASNLVPSDTNADPDVFVRDRGAGTTIRVSERSDGVQGDAASITPAVSRNGRYVAFASDATNLAGTPVSGGRDVLVRDLQTGEIEVASVKQNGEPAGGASGVPGISADGRFVVFQSFASDVVTGDTNDHFDVFLRDRVLGETTRVSVDSTGGQATAGDSFNPDISADGETVVFSSDATNLVTGDTNGVTDIFAHDVSTGVTERVSVSSVGAQADGQSDGPGFRGGSAFGADASRNGRYVTFDSIAANLVTADTNSCSLPLGQSYTEPGQCPDIFVRDRKLGTTTRVSVATSGAQANHGSTDPAISNRGNKVAFFTFASNLSDDDTNVCRSDTFGSAPGRCPDIYLHRD